MTKKQTLQLSAALLVLGVCAVQKANAYDVLKERAEAKPIKQGTDAHGNGCTCAGCAQLSQ